MKRQEWELNGDVVSIILGYLREERSPFYDEEDMARDAASFMLVGNSSFSMLGAELYAQLSPRLGLQELPDGITEKSPVPKLKEVLKGWGLPVSGTKGMLWERIEDQVTPVHETLCPASRALKAHVATLRNARVSLNRAKDVFFLYKYQLEKLPTHMESTKTGMRATYSLRDVKAEARKQYPRWGQYQRMLEGRKGQKEAWDNATADTKARTDRVKEALMARGVNEVEASRGVNHLWHLPYMSFSWGSQAAPSEDQLLGCVNTVHAWCFVWHNTDMPIRFYVAKQKHKWGSGSRYRQEYTLECQCQREAQEVWLSDQPTLQAALSAAPECMRESLMALWDTAKRNKAEGKGPQRIHMYGGVEDDEGFY